MKHEPDTVPGYRDPRMGSHTWGAKTHRRQGLVSPTQGKSRMPELGPYGSMRGEVRKSLPYRDCETRRKPNKNAGLRVS